MKKLIIGTSLALALAASPAFAATHHSRVAPQAYGDESYAAVTSGPAVISYGQNVGWDPDPAIREDLMRQGPQGAEGGN